MLGLTDELYQTEIDNRKKETWWGTIFILTNLRLLYGVNEITFQLS